MTWALVLLPFSSALLWLGLHGRRTGDHPVCRRCGFDLCGKPADSRVCSECGADLKRRRAVRIGHRRRRRYLIALALPLLLLSTVWLGRIGWRAASRVNWIGHEPAFMLVRQAESRNASRRDAALLELLRRLDAGKLSRGTIDRLVHRALTLQADSSAPWSVLWGEFFERSREVGKVTDAQWEQYWRRIFSLPVSGAAAAPGNPLVVVVNCNGAAARYSGAPVHIEYNADSLAVDGVACEPGQLGGTAGGNATPQRRTLGIINRYETYMLPMAVGGWSSSPVTQSVPMVRAQSKPAPGGPMEVRSSVDVSVFRYRNLDGPRDLISFHMELKGIAIIPSGIVPVELVRLQSLRPAVLRSLYVGQVELSDGGQDPHTYWATFTVDGPPLPIDGCFDVELHQARAPFGWIMGPLQCRQGEPCHFEFRHKITGHPNGLADVVFKPSAEKAAAAGMERIWGETMIVRVPLVGPDSRQ